MKIRKERKKEKEKKTKKESNLWMIFWWVTPVLTVINNKCNPPKFQLF